MFSILPFIPLAATLIMLFAISPVMASTFAEENKQPKQIIVASEEWIDFAYRDGTGLYFEIMKAIYDPVGVKVKFLIEPFKRAMMTTINHQADVLVGTYSQDYRGNDLLLTPRHPINTDQVLAVFPADYAMDWQTIYQRNRADGSDDQPLYSTAWVIGYNYDNHLGIKKISEIKHIEQGLKMVASHRLDAFLDGDKAILNLLNGELSELKGKVSWEQVLKRNLYMAFTNTPKGAELCKIFDQRIMTLRSNGELERLFKKWEVSFKNVEFDAPSPHQRTEFCQYVAPQ